MNRPEAVFRHLIDFFQSCIIKVAATRSNQPAFQSTGAPAPNHSRCPFLFPSLVPPNRHCCRASALATPNPLAARIPNICYMYPMLPIPARQKPQLRQCDTHSSSSSSRQPPPPLFFPPAKHSPAVSLSVLIPARPSSRPAIISMASRHAVPPAPFVSPTSTWSATTSWPVARKTVRPSHSCFSDKISRRSNYRRRLHLTHQIPPRMRKPRLGAMAAQGDASRQPVLLCGGAEGIYYRRPLARPSMRRRGSCREAYKHRQHGKKHPPKNTSLPVWF